jgi:glycosyltransferase involved in cell wall biosynthesis
MIYVSMRAYNAEKTVAKALESVLSQSCGDFSFNICDNGSSDATARIIGEYAKHDSRIRLFHNTRNNEWNTQTLKNVRQLERHISGRDHWCQLDADDYYEHGFFEEMLRFISEYGLDYAVCRSNYINGNTGIAQNEYVLRDSIIISGSGFGVLFPDYFRFMGARWGKLISGSLLNRVDFPGLDNYLTSLALSHRSDTASMLWYLRYSSRAGVLAKALHNYAQYQGSASRQDIDSKIEDNYKMPQIYRDFLLNKAGQVSGRNEAYIAEVFERSMRRTAAQGGASE